MTQEATPNGDGTFDLDVRCDFCGKPITTTGKNGMSCEDRCADKWVRWDRLRRPAFQEHLRKLGKLDEATEEMAALRALLFRPDGTAKFSGR